MEDFCELPIKRRRSSIKRKSLVETFALIKQSANGNSTQLSKKNERLSLNHSNVSAQYTSPITLPTVDETSACSDSVKSYILEKYSVLQVESQKWKKLLHDYTVQEEEARIKRTSYCLEFDKSPENINCKVGSIDYNDLMVKVEQLEQRLFKSMGTVSETVRSIQERKEILKTKLKSMMDREVEISLGGCTTVDPRSLIENILLIDSQCGNVT